MITDDGRINENGAPYTGMMRFDVRVKLEEDLKKLGLYVGKKDNKMQIPICSRSGDIVEPLLKPQWYVDCSEMAARAVEAVKKGELVIMPKEHENTWYRWLENIQPWCISRQLWWGHRIPAYRVLVQEGDKWVDNDVWVAARDAEEAKQKGVAKLGVAAEKVRVEQDPDVLDTWFSSGLFPFSVFGWPKETDDLKAFFPTTLLETGHDILFFWVARMVMLSLELTDKLPFKQVYLHAMIRDKYGRKMSKSLGNVIDPLEVINGCTLEAMLEKIRHGNLDPSEVEKASQGKRQDFPDGIPMCGTDALRFGLLAYTIQGININLDIQRVIGYRNFCNKLWNAVKFGLMNLEGFSATQEEIEHIDVKSLAPRDQWILSRLSQTAAACNKNFADYEFANVTTQTYNFWLYTLCDRYLEMIKPVINGSDAEAKKKAQMTLYICLEQGLRLLHPMMPFITEELWQRVTARPGFKYPQSIMLASYPVENPAWTNPKLEEEMELLDAMVHEARSLKSDYNLTRKNNPTFYLAAADDETLAVLQSLAEDFKTLSQAGEVIVSKDAEFPHSCAMKHINTKVTVLVNLQGIVDFAQEITKLTAHLKDIQARKEKLEGKMSVEAYVKVPEDIKETFERLGIPQAERKSLAGVGAQYDSELVYHNVKDSVAAEGVVYTDMESAMKGEYADMVRKYFMKLVTPRDHKFAALHGAVWSGGSFVYVPKGVHLSIPLQSYFRLNAKGAGQFEHTLIIVDEGASLHFIEGCSAPKYNVANLHAGCVELFVKKGAKLRYSTIENWSKNMYNLNTKRALVEEGGTIEWISGSFGSHVGCLYPMSILKGDNSRMEFTGVTFAGAGQNLDTGAKVVHVGKNTSSYMNTRSISKSAQEEKCGIIVLNTILSNERGSKR